MSNPTSVIELTDDLAAFLAQTNQFGEANQLLIQPKRNKSPGNGVTNPGFPASSSVSNSVAQWPNMVDDFLLKFFDWSGGVGLMGAAMTSPGFTYGITVGGGEVIGGTGAPEGVITAGVGSIFLRVDGSSGASIYSKTSGTGNTGWEALGIAAGGGEANTGSNLGAGEGVFATKVGIDLRFKSLTSSDDHVALSSTGTEIDLVRASTTGSFLDNATEDVTLGSNASFTLIEVLLSVRGTSGEASAYRMLLSGSGSAAIGTDILRQDSGTPVTTVAVSALYVTTDYTLRMVGSGGGATINYTLTTNRLA